ncbi:MAG: DUF393 domain-containing protein [Planctomycetota bacterium]
MPTEVHVRVRVNDRFVVIYDGECAFCIAQIERIKKWDVNRTFECVPRQADGILERFPELAEGDFNTGMRVIAPSGRIHVGADAVYEIARRLPTVRWLAWVYRVPGCHQMGKAMYAWVAANRQSLGRCRPDNTCGK